MARRWLVTGCSTGLGRALVERLAQAGERVVAMLGWAPESGRQTLGTCIFSYDGRLHVGFKVDTIPWIGPRLDAILPAFITQGLHTNFYFGGTSLLIVVGVAMDTVQQVESQLIMRHYDGFLKKGRIRGRRG